MRVDLEKMGIDEASPEDEDFAAMFHEKYKNDEEGDGRLCDALIVKITDESVFVDVSEKVEGRFNVNEIRDENGALMFSEGDKILVYLTRKNGENFSVSYKKAISFQKAQEKIKELGEDFKNTVIDGVITRKNKNGLIVESEGIEYFMPRAQSLAKEDVGKKIRVLVINVRPSLGSIVVSRRKYLDYASDLQQKSVQKFLAATEPLHGIVRTVMRFGVFVTVDGVDGLVHASEISHKGLVNPLNVYKEGDEVYVKAIRYDEEKKNLSFSIKALYENPWDNIDEILKVGYTVKARVANIEKYGAFLDIGDDLVGFMHISEISWSKNLHHPSDKIAVGDELEVEIIDINKEQKTMRLSLKKLQENPFKTFMRMHKIGDELEGTVAKITDFGAFLRLDLIDGLLHNEDFSWDGKKCKDILKVGDKLKAKLLKIDEKNQRISLGTKDAKDSPAARFAKSHRTDEIMDFEVVDVRDFGVFVKNDEISALIRNDDIIGKKDELKKGDKLTAAIAHIDKTNNKIRASMKSVERIRERENLKNFNQAPEMTLGDKLKGQIKIR